MNIWQSIKNGPPPRGIPLIVTVACADDGKHGPKIAYPVVYRKSFIRDEWGFYEHGMEDGLIGPDYYRVTAWMPFPKPYRVGEIDIEPYRPDKRTCWVSVEEELPEKGQETWVYALPPDGVDAEPEIDVDTYEGNRGEIVKFSGPRGDGEEPSSGWYTYSGWNVTHWMPFAKPEAPV